MLLPWAQHATAGHPNVSVTNFSSAWADGLAFRALVHHHLPEAVGFGSDMEATTPEQRKEHLEAAFGAAEERASVPRLLDVQDMLDTYPRPDKKCVLLYLTYLHRQLPRRE